MKFFSTRDDTQQCSFEDIITHAISKDAGLFMPHTIPSLDLAAPNLTYSDIAKKTFHAFCSPHFANTISQYIDTIYQSSYFTDPNIAPVKQIEDNLYLLDLTCGPTLSFKDYALQILPKLIDANLAQTKQRLNIITATSGDTGSAAIYGFAGCKNINLTVLHPKDKISTVQRLQMTTVNQPNILNIAVEGDFDHCQSIVKHITTGQEKSLPHFSTVNSINFGRLVGQITYYLNALYTLTNHSKNSIRYNFFVPTGNFGNALSALLASMMIDEDCPAHLNKICVSLNANDTLFKFVNNNGILQKQPTIQTFAPAMDVSLPSNFERLIYLATSKTAQTAKLYKEYSQSGQFCVPSTLDFVNQFFDINVCQDKKIIEGIQLFHKKYNKVIDPHTATAYMHYLTYAKTHDASDMTNVIVSTAHPCKFSQTVHQALGFEPEIPQHIQKLHTMPEHYLSLKTLSEVVNACQKFV